MQNLCHCLNLDQDASHGASSAGESEHYQKRINNSLICSHFLGRLAALPTGLPFSWFQNCTGDFFWFGDGAGCGLSIVLTGMFLHTYLNSDTFSLSSIALELKFLGSKLLTFRKLEAIGSIAFPTVSRG